MVIVNSQVCVPEVQLYEMDLAVSRARCNDPCYYPFICPNRSRVLPFPGQGLQRWSCDCQGLTSRARCTAYTFLFFFPSRLTLPFPSPNITNRVHAYCKARLKQVRESSKENLHAGVTHFISIRRRTNLQAGGDGS